MVERAARVLTAVARGAGVADWAAEELKVGSGVGPEATEMTEEEVLVVLVVAMVEATVVACSAAAAVPVGIPPAPPVGSVVATVVVAMVEVTVVVAMAVAMAVAMVVAVMVVAVMVVVMVAGTEAVATAVVRATCRNKPWRAAAREVRLCADDFLFAVSSGVYMRYLQPCRGACAGLACRLCLVSLPQRKVDSFALGSEAAFPYQHLPSG